MAYNQYPFIIKFKDSASYWDAHLWAGLNLMKGLWTPDYTRDYTLKFTLKKDAVIVALKFQ